jgi:hypothetical protein
VTTPVSPLSPAPTPAASAEPGRLAAFPNTIIVYQQKGDTTRQWTIYRTGRILADDGTERMVPAAQVTPLFELVERLDFWQLGSAYTAGDECPTCPLEVLTVYRGGEVKEITAVGEHAGLPAVLQQALDEISRLV